jgi:hypothetical protein
VVPQCDSSQPSSPQLCAGFQTRKTVVYSGVWLFLYLRVTYCVARSQSYPLPFFDELKIGPSLPKALAATSLRCPLCVEYKGTRCCRRSPMRRADLGLAHGQALGRSGQDCRQPCVTDAERRLAQRAQRGGHVRHAHAAQQRRKLSQHGADDAAAARPRVGDAVVQPLRLATQPNARTVMSDASKIRSHHAMPKGRRNGKSTLAGTARQRGPASDAQHPTSIWYVHRSCS